MLNGPRWGLEDICVYVPETSISVEQAIVQGQANGVPFASSVREYAARGFQQVPVEERLGYEDMVRQVMAPAVRRAAARHLKIAAILFASVTNEDQVHRQAVVRAARELGLAHTPVIQLGEYGCSTIHLALHLAEQLFATPGQGGKAVLVVTADKAGKPTERVNRYMVFGDGACAVLCTAVPRSRGHAIYGVETRADGIVYEDTPAQVQRYFATCYLGVRHVVKALLRRCPVPWEQIRTVYCTNLGVEQWSPIAMAIGCAPEQIYGGTLADAGHLHNVDVIHSIAHSVGCGHLQPGDYYMTLSVGFGGYYGCALHRYVPDEGEVMR